VAADLVERARQGDRDAFASLAAAHVDRLNAVARLILRDADVADDAVQEALVRCWRFLPTLRDVERFDGWLYRLLMRAVNDEFRRRRRFRATMEAIQSELTVSDGASNLADRDQLERGFRRLSVDHRAIVVLHHYLGLPLTEAAAALDIPVGTAKSRYHHAMSALRAALEAEARLGNRREVPA
jgi:RNA polymerase sigma-70 factor, ECF subfamily